MIDLISFEEWLTEKLSVPNLDLGLNKMRHAMPQLTRFDDFICDLETAGIDTEVRTLSPDKLTPTQKNFSEAKVDCLINDKVWDAKPIITSKDDFVIDGHHRWLAASKLGKDIQARVIDMTATDLLAFLKNKPYVETKTINE